LVSISVKTGISSTVVINRLNPCNFILCGKGLSPPEKNKESKKNYSGSKTVFNQLSVISYQLSVISYQLSVISYQLSVISYQLSVISQIKVILSSLSEKWLINATKNN